MKTGGGTRRCWSWIMYLLLGKNQIKPNPTKSNQMRFLGRTRAEPREFHAKDAKDAKEKLFFAPVATVA